MHTDFPQRSTRVLAVAGAGTGETPVAPGARFFMSLAVAVLANALWFQPAAAQDMRLSDILIDGQNWELVGQGYKFTEGPAVDKVGNLFFTDVPNNRIHKLGPDGKVVVFAENPAATNGLMFGPDGRLYGCQNGNKRIVAIDSAGKPASSADGVESNDLVVTRSGGVYFTDPAHKRVWYVPPKGEKRVVDEGIAFPNGIILWPDQGTLVVANMNGPHLWAFRIESDGSLKFKQPYYTMQLPDFEVASGADGLTVDSLGRLYATSKLGLQMFDPTGRLSGVIAKPQNAWLANVVLGGPKFDTLYVTCTDKVYRRKIRATGVLYFQPPVADKPAAAK